MKLKKAERQKRIVTAITANAALGVSELAADLGVSKQTVRRDLDELSVNGEVNRTYGGAAARPAGLEPSFMERRHMSVAERAQIAEVASELFGDGETIMIGPGVTTHHFAQVLATRYNRLQVFTNSLGVATIMANNSSNRVVLTPGEYDPAEGCVCGAETLAFLEKFRADTAVFSASGVDEDGVYEVHSGTAWVDRAMLQRSNRHILLLPHTKFDEPRLELICPLSALDIFVADQRPEGGLLDALNSQDVEIKTPVL